jgi:alanyl-tRNA synthetase
MLEELRKFNLQFFADGGDSGGGSDAGSNDGGDTGGTGDAGGTGGKDDNAGGGAGGQGNQGAGGKTYSQEEAERIAAQREERARRSALKSYFEQQGYSQEEVEELLKKDKERREKEKTDLEREKEAREKAEKEREKAIETANARIAKTEFKIAAQAAGVPADRLEAAVKLADLSELVPDEKTGEIPADVVKSVVEATLQANPFLKETKAPPNVGGGGSNPGGGGGEPSIEELGKLSMEEYIRLRNAKK